MHTPGIARWTAPAACRTICIFNVVYEVLPKTCRGAGAAHQMVDCITQGSTLRRTLVRPYASLHDTGNSWYALGSMPAREREGGEAHPGVIELLHGNVGLCLESPKRRSGRQLALGQQTRNLRAGTPPYARHRTAGFSVPSRIGSEVEERTIQGCEMWRCIQGELLVYPGRRQPSAPD